MKKLWIIALFIATIKGLTVTGYAQSQTHTAEKLQRTIDANAPRVVARFIPDSIVIGDQFRLRIEVTKDIVQQVAFPERDTSNNMLMDKVEIIKEFDIDTANAENRRVTLVKEFLLTCFDAGRYSLDSIPVLYMDKNIIDTIYAIPSPATFQVTTFEIDTLTQKIYDIKPPVKMPLRFGEFSGYMFGSLAVIAIALALVYFIRRWRKNHKVFWRERVVEPPHVIAISALEALHHQKLWQNNKHKLYYTLLTDIVRTYIESRYAIPAMEMTTDELLAALKPMALTQRNLSRLASMLRMGDLAKFAKYAPAADDNESAYEDAYYFVEDTKPTEIESPPQQEQL